MIIIESLRFPYRKLFPDKLSLSYSKIEKTYNNEIHPLLEAFALFHQMKIAPTDLREQLIIEARKEPLLFEKLKWLEEILKKVMEKNLTHDANPFVIFGNLASITFSSLNVEKERVTDRLKLLRDVDLPWWENDSDLVRYIIDCFHENGLSITLTPYGTTESVFSAAIFLQVIKNIYRTIPEPLLQSLEDYVLGILSEIDVQIGPISYTCSSLDTLEDKKINYCYLGCIARGKDFFTPLELTKNVICNLLSKKLDTKDKQLLLDYDEDLSNLSSIKKEIFQKCAGPECCRGKADCILRAELGQRVMNSILIRNI
jgi:uncharacterized protein YqgV (UPF0045/DUF77 family)